MNISISDEQLKIAAVHESSHAVMAVLRDLPCWGIFLQGEHDQVDVKFCCLVTNGTPLEKSDYLHSAAGAAGELLFFGEYDYGPTDLDRMIFTRPGAPSWDETVEEARSILTAEREKIQTIVSLVEEKVTHTPDSMVKTRRMAGDTRVFRELVPAGKLYLTLGRTAPDTVVSWLRAQLGRQTTLR
jgi:hypothetical protein